jgi:hypothetical protein
MLAVADFAHCCFWKTRVRYGQSRAAERRRRKATGLKSLALRDSGVAVGDGVLKATHDVTRFCTLSVPCLSRSSGVVFASRA